MKRIIAPILLVLSPTVLWDTTLLGSDNSKNGNGTKVNAKIVRYSHEISNRVFIDMDTLAMLEPKHIDLLTEGKVSLSTQTIDIPPILHINPSIDEEHIDKEHIPPIVIETEKNLHSKHVDLHLNPHLSHHWNTIHIHGHSGNVVFAELWHEAASSHGWHSWVQHFNTNQDDAEQIHFDRTFEISLDRMWFELGWELLYDPKHGKVDEIIAVSWFPIRKGSYKILIADVVWPHGNMIWPWFARANWSIFVALSNDGTWMIKAKFILGNWSNSHHH